MAVIAIPPITSTLKVEMLSEPPEPRQKLRRREFIWLGSPDYLRNESQLPHPTVRRRNILLILLIILLLVFGFGGYRLGPGIGYYGGGAISLILLILIILLLLKVI
jgi:Protein of unknown function (DUF3309)